MREFSSVMQRWLCRMVMCDTCGVCLYLCAYIFGLCICVFLSRKQIHGILLTFKSQQREDPVSFPKYRSRGNSNTMQNQPPSFIRSYSSLTLRKYHCGERSIWPSVQCVPHYGLGGETHSKDACPCQGPKTNIPIHNLITSQDSPVRSGFLIEETLRFKAKTE